MGYRRQTQEVCSNPALLPAACCLEVSAGYQEMGGESQAFLPYSQLWNCISASGYVHVSIPRQLLKIPMPTAKIN